MGPSGSGKSTLLYTISGMDTVTSGSVVLDGLELTSLPEEKLSEMRLRKMGFVFQDIHLLKNLSIFDNVILPGYLSRDANRKQINRRAHRLMETVDIPQLADHDITQASGGQLQRVGICRALINQPCIIFGDEPTGALNSKAAEKIMSLLTEINQSGTTILLVTHNVRIASQADRILYMLDGEIISQIELGKFGKNGQDKRAREEKLSQWLLEMGF
jgi:putative ABC transport system ATP-binding protein